MSYDTAIVTSQAHWRAYQNEVWREPQGTKRKLSEIFHFNQFRGSRCFVLGGGPSLRKFKFSKLENEYTIGVNKICQLFSPWISFLIDEKLLPFVREHAWRSKIVFCDRSNNPQDDIFYVRDRGGHGIPDSIDHIFAGDNSGYGAVNLAIALGFDPIYLLGFDFCLIGGKSHAFDAWGHPGAAEDYQRKFLTRFRKEFEDLARYCPVKIYNLSLDSDLAAFPKVSIKEVLDG